MITKITKNEHNNDLEKKLQRGNYEFQQSKSVHKVYKTYKIKTHQ